MALGDIVGKEVLNILSFPTLDNLQAKLSKILTNHEHCSSLSQEGYRTADTPTLEDDEKKRQHSVASEDEGISDFLEREGRGLFVY